MFDGTNFILITDVDQDKYMSGSDERSLTYHASSPSTYKPFYLVQQ